MTFTRTTGRSYVRQPVDFSAPARYGRRQHNWPSADVRVVAALAERGNDLRVSSADGGHDPNPGGAILTDALRSLWRTETD